MNDEERQRLISAFSDVFSREELDERIEEARNHKAIRKVEREYLYLRGWVRREAERIPGYREAHRNGSPPGRDISKYFVWPSGRQA